jgi:hypothetical protein
MRVLLHPHAWTTSTSVHIGLTAEPKPEDLAHELMHVVLADRGYPNALRFSEFERVETMVGLCGILDLEVDRSLRVMGMTFRDTADEAQAMMDADLDRRHWSPGDAAMILLGRLRAISQSDVKSRFEVWARDALPEAFAVATRLDEALPPALDPEAVAVGVVLAGELLAAPIQFIPAPWSVHSPEQLPGWLARVRARAVGLGVGETVEPSLTQWLNHQIVQEDWSEPIKPSGTRTDASLKARK